MKFFRNAVCALFAAALVSSAAVARGQGHVWAWGAGASGQLGNGTFTDSSLPVQVKNLSGVVVSAGGYYHTLALKNDGTIWIWGSNDYGQLGNGTLTNSNLPLQVENLSGVIAVAGGWAHSLAVKNDGTVWAWGNNESGQLGNGTFSDSSLPVQVQNLSAVVAVAAGQQHSVALKNDGTVWAWGNGYVVNAETGSLPVQVHNLSGVVAVAAGDGHSLALKDDGTVWAWGSNWTGQLGNGTFTDSSLPVRVKNLSGVVAVAAGYYHSLALKNDGTVRAWGDDGVGELGKGTFSDKVNQPVQVKNLSGVVAVAGGGGHSLALKSDGMVWAWGLNDDGELGDDTITNSSLPVLVSGLSGVAAISAGAHHSLAVEGATPPAQIPLTLAAAAGQIGKKAILHAALKNPVSGVKLAGRTVLFKIDGADVGTASTDDDGVALCAFAVPEGTALGSHPTAANFAGDQDYAPASASSTITISKGTVNLGLPNKSAYLGQAIAFTAALKNHLGAALVGQSISFTLDGSAIGSAITDSAGKATLNYTIAGDASLGTHAITASFAGDSNYLAATKNATLTVNKIPVKLTVRSVTGYAGKSVILSATLLDASNTPLASVTLSFTVNGALVGTATTDGTGKATLPYAITAGTAAGTYPITVNYAGDATHLPSTKSGTLTVK